MHNGKFGSCIAVVPERRGLDLFGAGEVVPVVSDTIGVSSRRLNRSAGVSLQLEEQICQKVRLLRVLCGFYSPEVLAFFPFDETRSAGLRL